MRPSDCIPQSNSVSKKAKEKLYFWAGISSRGFSDFVIFTNNLNRFGYSYLLKNHLVPFINSGYKNRKVKLIHDKNSKHTSKLCVNLLKNLKIDWTYLSGNVNIGGSLKRSLLYVALSRATNLNGLYLFGAKSIVSDNIRKMTQQQRQDEIDKRERTDDLRKEMKRLREESMLKNLYQSLDLIETNRIHKPCRQSGDKFFCLFQNIQHFNPKRDILRKDFSYLSMDVILLAEGHNLIQYKYQAEHLFDHFELIHFSAPISRQTSTDEKSKRIKKKCILN
ncbi:hypothetical protein BpHYR1_003078 [Brachionus plicatilis]|uniref:Uncharacterized protein n=1 Tax=Brachionus plicatilis TaxID=10195 RepID=A0A3M7QNI4_BRAPC|nr:hypothetical protein BpHYR1_003078 [Brachionus plicatilis]